MGGLCRILTTRVTKGTAAGWLLEMARDWPGTERRVHSAAATSTAPEHPGHMRAAGAHPPSAKAPKRPGRGASCSSGPALPPKPPPSPFNVMETPKHSSLCCAKAGQRGEEGQEQAAQGQGASSPDPSQGQLIYLFWLKKVTRNFALHLA